MQDNPRETGSQQSALLYLKHQIVNLDCIAEISVKRDRVTLRYAFARLDEPGARLFLSPGEAEPLLIYLRAARETMPGWVTIADRLVNLDLAADIWVEHDQLQLVLALPDQRGGPLIRSFTRQAGRSILAYFRPRDARALESNSIVPFRQHAWVTVGTHLINLALVSGIRFTPQHVNVSFVGLPNFVRVFGDREATPLIERLQQLGVLPIEAVPSHDEKYVDE